MKLQDKVCIVTGAASGIGKEIALEFTRARAAKIVVADLNMAGGAMPPRTETRKAAGQPGDRRWRLNVTDEAQVDASASPGEHQGLRQHRRADQQRRHSDRPPDRGIPASRNGRRLLVDPPRRRVPDDQGAPASGRCIKASKKGGSIIYMGSVHSKEASVLKAALRHRQARPDRAGQGGVEGRRRARRARQRHLPPASCARRWWTSKSPSRPSRWASRRTT